MLAENSSVPAIRKAVQRINQIASERRSLKLVRECHRLLSVRAEDAELGELGANPAYAPPSPSRDAMTEAALLAVLAVAVLLLGLLTFRLVRSEPLEGLATPGEPHSTTSQGPVATEDATESAPGPSDPGAGGEPSNPGEGASPDERDKLPG